MECNEPIRCLTRCQLRLLRTRQLALAQTAGIWVCFTPDTREWFQLRSVQQHHYPNFQDMSTSTIPSGLPPYLSDATHEALMRAGNAAHLELYKNLVAVTAENKALK